MRTPSKVLFLCTGNSARSILAEAYLNASGAGRFLACSAGSHPVGSVNRFALELLHENRIDTSALRSKSWDEFARNPAFDFVFTVCGEAAGEACPVWPGQPIRAHWGVEDPARVEGSDDDKRGAFLRAYTVLARRIDRFRNLPFDALERPALQARVDDIGRVRQRAAG